MSERFEVGEVAIYVRPGSRHYGIEVEVVGPFALYETIRDLRDDAIYHNEYRYPISGAPWGRVFVACRPEWLRKKPKKRDIDQTVSWDECLWRPGIPAEGVVG